VKAVETLGKLRAAAADVEGGKGRNEAALAHGVPKSTLSDFIARGEVQAKAGQPPRVPYPVRIFPLHPVSGI